MDPLEFRIMVEAFHRRGTGAGLMLEVREDLSRERPSAADLGETWRVGLGVRCQGLVGQEAKVSA
jgi:hypothetical protein